MMWPGDAAPEVARRYRDVALAAPDALGSGLVFLTGPPEEFVPAHLQGTTVVGIAALWAGEVNEGADAVAPFRGWRPRSTSSGRCPTRSSSA